MVREISRRIESCVTRSDCSAASRRVASSSSRVLAASRRISSTSRAHLPARAELGLAAHERAPHDVLQVLRARRA